MDRSDFIEACPGRLEETAFIENTFRNGKVEAKRVSGVGFVPDPLPSRVLVSSLLEAVWPDLMAAERAISQLEGIAHRLPNPHLLINVFTHREAILSSRIEDTFASAEDLALFEFVPASVADRDQVAEVHNYVRALEHGLNSDLPVCLRLIRRMHEILLHETTRPAVAPGQFRQTQNAIGSGRSFSKATFVPPPPQFVDPCMQALEGYINCQDSRFPRLLDFGMIHYQFEAIHPFLDGNGRLGRLLITLLICRHGQLSKPFVYVSSFFEQNRERYYELLYRVSTKGAWTPWLKFFLEAVSTQAYDAIQRADRLIDLQADFHQRVREKRASALLPELIDRLFTQPSTTAASAQRHMKCTPQTASNLIKRLVEKEILVEVTQRRHGRVYIAPDIIHLIYD